MSIPNTLDGRIRQLDGLRAIAILMVLIEHSIRPPLFWVGVDIFFVLSGFLITSILLERKQERRSYFSYFYTRRVFRILPPYLVAVLAAAIYYGPSFLHFWPYFAFFGMNFFVLAHRSNMILPFWSLAVEEQFYLLWPLIVFALSERRVFRVAVAGILFTPLLRVLATPLISTYAPVYFLTPFRADLLCAGAALAFLWRNHRRRVEDFGRRFSFLGVLAAFGCMAAVQISPHLRIVSNTRASNGLVYSLSVLGSASLLLWALVGRGRLYRTLMLAPLRYIGQVSYTVYLIHLIFFGLVSGYTSHRIVIFVLGSALSIAFAALSWKFMERPAIRQGARLAPGSPPPPVPISAQA